MAYLVCSQCGGKALAVSTRCPRCQTPFPRVEDRTPPAPRSLRVPIVIAGAILVIVGGGYALWLTQNGKPVDVIVVPTASAPTDQPVSDSSGNSAGGTAKTAGDTVQGPVAAPPVAVSPAPAAVTPAATPVIPGDPVRGGRAVVRGDVNLRKTASRDGESLRILRIDQPVELGPFQEGWRQVRLGSVVGWADPRHFEVIAKRR